MARFIALAIALATAGAFSPPPGLALLHNSASSSPVMRRSRPSGLMYIKMTAPVEQLAEQATLIATSFAESAYTNPDRYFPKVFTYPDGLVSGMKAYFNIFVPTFKGLNLPPFLLHWFHAVNMGIVLFAMGGYGTYLGWNIRSSPQDKFKTAPLPAPLAGSIADLGKSTAEMHATLMTAMGFIFFLGANGGLVLSLVQDKPITESVHFTTAMIGFAMLAIQGSLTKLFEGQNAQSARTAHALFGTATMLVFLFHASQGLDLGLKYIRFDEDVVLNLQWAKMQIERGDAWQ